MLHCISQHLFWCMSFQLRLNYFLDVWHIAPPGLITSLPLKFCSSDYFLLGNQIADAMKKSKMKNENKKRREKCIVVLSYCCHCLGSASTQAGSIPRAIDILILYRFGYIVTADCFVHSLLVILTNPSKIANLLFWASDWFANCDLIINFICKIHFP